MTEWYRLERRVRVWENIGCVASVSSRVIARKLEISSQRSRRTRAETLATQARENTSRSGEVEETFTVILKNASPPPPLRPHPRHFPTSNSASIYLSCLYAERLTVRSISGGWVWAHFPEQRLVIEPRLTGIHRRTIQATPFLFHFRDPPDLPGENDILHLRETTNQVLVPNMVNQHPLWNSDRPPCWL